MIDSFHLLTHGISLSGTQTGEKKGEKSPRRPKDPNAPKRPRTAFLVYNSNVEVRKLLKEEFPEASPRDLMRMLGERWVAMKPEEKERFEQVAKQEQTIYKAEKETYAKKKAAEQGKVRSSVEVNVCIRRCLPSTNLANNTISSY